MAVRKKTVGNTEAQAIQKANSAARVAAKAVKDAEKLLARQPSMTEAQVEDIVERVSARVITQTFASLGIDLTDRDEIKELKHDREYNRAWRQTIQKGTRTGWLTFVTVATTGFVGVLYVAFKIIVTGHP